MKLIENALWCDQTNKYILLKQFFLSNYIKNNPLSKCNMEITVLLFWETTVTGVLSVVG